MTQFNVITCVVSDAATYQRLGQAFD